MSCALTTGRTEPCKDNIGGLKNIYLFPYVYYTYSQIVGTRGSEITSFPVNTTVYQYEINGGNFTETPNNDENGLYYEQSLTFSLLKQDLATTTELNRAMKLDLRYIVEFNDGSLKVGGLWKGARITTINQLSGGAKTDFNGYRVTITSREEYMSAYISSLDIITGGESYIFQDDNNFIFQDSNNYIFN